MKLTGRQEAFLRQMLNLYHETNKPLRYPELAERVGVSRFTAYDMLRLLEEKGLVTSDYLLAADKAGPGRSEIVFMPTERTRRLLAQFGAEDKDWDSWREELLEQVEHKGLVEANVVEEILARIPLEEAQPLRYCVEVITIIVLRLKRAAGRSLLLEFMPKIMSGADISEPQSLALLGGFALGILVEENAEDHEWCKELLEHVQHVGTLVAEMPPEMLQRLTRFLQALFASVREQLA